MRRHLSRFPLASSLVRASCTVSEAGFANITIVRSGGTTQSSLLTQVSSPRFPPCRLTQHVQIRTDSEPPDPARDIALCLLSASPSQVILRIGSLALCHSGSPIRVRLQPI